MCGHGLQTGALCWLWTPPRPSLAQLMPMAEALVHEGKAACEQYGFAVDFAL